MKIFQEALDELISEVNLGVWQVCNHMRLEPEKRGMDQVYAAGKENRSQDACGWIFEFIKDGITGDLVLRSVDKDAFLEYFKPSTEKYLSHFYTVEG